MEGTGAAVECSAEVLRDRVRVAGGDGSAVEAREVVGDERLELALLKPHLDTWERGNERLVTKRAILNTLPSAGVLQRTLALWNNLCPESLAVEFT